MTPVPALPPIPPLDEPPTPEPGELTREDLELLSEWLQGVEASQVLGALSADPPLYPPPEPRH